MVRDFKIISFSSLLQLLVITVQEVTFGEQRKTKHGIRCVVTDMCLCNNFNISIFYGFIHSAHESP